MAKAADKTKRKSKRLHWGTFTVPARPVRSTRASRNDKHKAEMVLRRRRQLARTPGFIPIDRGAL